MGLGSIPIATSRLMGLGGRAILGTACRATGSMPTRLLRLSSRPHRARSAHGIILRILLGRGDPLEEALKLSPVLLLSLGGLGGQEVHVPMRRGKLGSRPLHSQLLLLSLVLKELKLLLSLSQLNPGSLQAQLGLLHPLLSLDGLALGLLEVPRHLKVLRRQRSSLLSLQLKHVHLLLEPLQVILINGVE